MAADLLRVEDLVTEFRTDDGVVHAVDGVSFNIRQGQTMGLVGESGCGKSVTALSVMGLIEHPGTIAGGKILFEGKDLVGLGAEEIRHVRGKEIAMIFQEPMTSLNPVYTVGDQIAEMARLHLHMDRKHAWEHAIEMLRTVKIAMAVSCTPKLLIADEPTTALDVTIQAQILD